MKHLLFPFVLFKFHQRQPKDLEVGLVEQSNVFVQEALIIFLSQKRAFYSIQIPTSLYRTILLSVITSSDNKPASVYKARQQHVTKLLKVSFKTRALQLPEHVLQRQRQFGKE